jgi:hypothetical protein
MDMSLEMLEKNGIINELASCFENHAAASHLLSKIGIELFHFPPFGEKGIKSWWQEVCKKIETGLSEEKGLDDLIKVASSEYPGNKHFKKIMIHDKKSIFLSHSSKNRSDVDRLFLALEKYPNYEIFQDYRSISPGKDWLEVIESSASNSSLMVCWVTEQYLESKFCHFEIGMAKSLDAKIVSILVDDTISKLPSYLERLQGIKPIKPIDYNALAKQLIDIC